MLEKLHFTLPEVAAEWSQFADRNITENDILTIAAYTLVPYVLLSKDIKVTHQQEQKHPSLSLHFYTSSPLPIKNANGHPYSEFIGRLFVDADHVLKILENGHVDVLVGCDTDTMCVFHFVNPVKVTKNDLVVTSENKALFEARYLGVRNHD